MNDTRQTSLAELIKKVETLRAQGKKVIQTHGVFDLIHPGIITHLRQAKAMGDFLVVTVIRDQHVRRGPGRPIFNENDRLASVLSLDMVDLACIVDDDMPFSCVRRIKPDIFAKGQSQKERDSRIHSKIFDEEREFYFGKAQIMETTGAGLSSSSILGQLGLIYTPEARAYLDSFRQRHSFMEICDHLDKFKGMKVLLIGDTIIDEYHYCLPCGKSAKSPIVVNKYVNHEVFGGGVAAIANHMAGICSKVTLISMLGTENSYKDFLDTVLKPNVDAHFFMRENTPTVMKKRYINPDRNQKLFEINYLDDSPLEAEIESDILDMVREQAAEHDLVIVSDFSHGLLTPKIVQAIRDVARILAVNTQTNGANAGFNLITKYKTPNFVCLDEIEARLALQDKHSAIEDIIQRLHQRVQPEKMAITLGKRGAIGIDQNGETVWAPAISSEVVDTVGAGDAFFSYTCLCHAIGLDMDLITFIGNAVGALAVRIVGNKSSVEKYDLLQYINALLRIDKLCPDQK